MSNHTFDLFGGTFVLRPDHDGWCYQNNLCRSHESSCVSCSPETDLCTLETLCSTTHGEALTDSGIRMMKRTEFLSMSAMLFSVGRTLPRRHLDEGVHGGATLLPPVHGGVLVEEPSPVSRRLVLQPLPSPREATSSTIA